MHRRIEDYYGYETEEDTDYTLYCEIQTHPSEDEQGIVELIFGLQLCENDDNIDELQSWETIYKAKEFTSKTYDSIIEGLYYDMSNKHSSKNIPSLSEVKTCYNIAFEEAKIDLKKRINLDL